MSDKPVDVVKFYTAARKIPSFVGRTHDGTKIPGGPYNVHAVITTAAVAALGYQLLGLSRDSSVTTWLVLGAVAIGAGFLVARMPTDGRNPLSVVAGATAQLTAPSTGRLGGRIVRIRSPHVAYGRTLIAVTPASAPLQAPMAEPALVTTTPSTPAATPRVELTTRRGTANRPLPSASEPPRTITSLSNVQLLLAGLPQE